MSRSASFPRRRPIGGRVSVALLGSLIVLIALGGDGGPPIRDAPVGPIVASPPLAARESDERLEALLAAGQGRRVITAAARRLARDPADVPAAFLLVRAARGSGRLDWLNGFLAALARRLPTAAILAATAELAATTGAHDERTLELIERARRAAPRNADLAVAHAAELAADGRLLEAIRIIEPWASSGAHPREDAAGEVLGDTADDAREVAGSALDPTNLQRLAVMVGAITGGPANGDLHLRWLTSAWRAGDHSAAARAMAYQASRTGAVEPAAAGRWSVRALDAALRGGDRVGAVTVLTAAGAAGHAGGGVRRLAAACHAHPVSAAGLRTDCLLAALESDWRRGSIASAARIYDQYRQSRPRNPIVAVRAAVVALPLLVSLGELAAAADMAEEATLAAAALGRTDLEASFLVRLATTRRLRGDYYGAFEAAGRAAAGSTPPEGADSRQAVSERHGIHLRSLMEGAEALFGMGDEAAATELLDAADRQAFGATYAGDDASIRRLRLTLAAARIDGVAGSYVDSTVGFAGDSDADFTFAFAGDSGADSAFAFAGDGGADPELAFAGDRGVWAVGREARSQALPSRPADPPRRVFAQPAGGALEIALEATDARLLSLQGSPQASLVRYQQALEALEELRSSLQDPFTRMALDESFQHISRLAMAVAFDAGRPDVGLGILERARAWAPGEPVALDDWTADLPAEVAVVAYSIGPEVARATVLRRGGAATVELPISAGLLRDRALLYESSLLAADVAVARPVGERLQEVLIAPLLREGALAGVASLYVVPDGALHLLSFAALPVSRHGELLADRFAVAQAPSLELLGRSLRRPPASGPVIAVAAGGGADQIAELDSVLGVEMPSYATGVLLRGPRATETHWRRVAARASVIHFGGHALAAPGDERGAGLRLRGDGLADGIVTVAEILATELPGPTVVLLACDTAARPAPAVAGAHSGQTPSIAEAFLIAGARAVVGSLWPITERDARLLAAAFYRAGGPARGLAALDDARRSLRERWPNNPRLWAGIVWLGAAEAPAPAVRNAG